MGVIQERLREAGYGGRNRYQKARKTFRLRNVDSRFRESSIFIDQSELNSLFARLDKYAREIKDPKWRKEVAATSARLVVASARAKTPRSRRPHYVYNTTKFIKGRRSKRGSVPESEKTLYVPGNLQLSIQHLTRLTRTDRAVIGPRILRRATAKKYGEKASRSNGFYAQMLYGSAVAFRRQIMEPALREQSSRILRYIDRQIEKKSRKEAQKQRFSTAA